MENKTRLLGVGSCDANAVLLGLVNARLRIEFSYCKLCVERGALCTVNGERGFSV